MVEGRALNLGSGGERRVQTVPRLSPEVRRGSEKKNKPQADENEDAQRSTGKGV